LLSLVVHRFDTAAGSDWTFEVPIPNQPRLRGELLVAWVVYASNTGPELRSTQAVLLGPGR